MKIIIVDDEKLALKQFEMELEGIQGVELAGCFQNPFEALEFLKTNPIAAVFLDIEMPGMDGLLLGKEIKELYPNMVIIYITGYTQYVLDALRLKADFYLIKPYEKKDIEDAMQRAKLLAKRQKKRIYAQMFGRFDLFIDDNVVPIQNAKAKELLALCLDHLGGSVSMEEAIDKLWENRAYDDRVKNLYRKAVMEIKHLMKSYDLPDVFQSNRGTCNITREEIDCDYYQFLEKLQDGQLPEIPVEYYLEEYSWAEETAARMEQKWNRVE